MAPPETVMETHIDAFIDDDYIHNGGQKIEMYQRMAVLQSVQELDELQKELIDRYGKPTKPVETLLEATRIRLRGKAMGLVLIAQKKTTLELKWQNLHGMRLWQSLRQRCGSAFVLSPVARRWYGLCWHRRIVNIYYLC